MTKTYTIGGRTFEQGPLTLSRLQRLTRLVATMGMDGLGGGTPSGAISTLIAHLTSADLPAEFFQIILSGPTGEVDWGEVDANELVEVVEDFFGLNGKIALKLTGFLRGLLPSVIAGTAAPNGTSAAPTWTPSDLGTATP